MGTKQGGNEEEKSCFWANQGQMSWIIREKKSAAKKYWYIGISELFVKYLDKYLEASAFVYILEPSPGSWWFATFDKAEYWVLISRCEILSIDTQYWKTERKYLWCGLINSGVPRIAASSAFKASLNSERSFLFCILVDQIIVPRWTFGSVFRRSNSGAFKEVNIGTFTCGKIKELNSISANPQLWAS